MNTTRRSRNLVTEVCIFVFTSPLGDTLANVSTWYNEEPLSFLGPKFTVSSPPAKPTSTESQGIFSCSFKIFGFVSNKDNVTDRCLNSSWYFRSPYFFFRALTRLRTARASGKNQPRPQGFSLIILSRSREFGNFKAKSWRDLRLSSEGRMPEINLGITGLHEILGRHSGIKKLYWGPSKSRFFEKAW